MKKIKLSRFWKIVILCFALALILFEGIRIYALYKVKTVLNTKLAEAGNKGFQIDYNDLQIGWFNSSLFLTKLTVTQLRGLDTVGDCRVSKLGLHGISIRKAILSKKLEIENVVFDHADLRTFDKATRYDSVVLRKREPDLEKVVIGKLTFKDIHWQRINLENNISVRAYVEKVEIDDLGIETAGPYTGTWKVASTECTELVFDFPNTFYALKMANVKYDAKRELLVGKNLRLNPYYNKNEFAKKRGRQLDRLELEVKDFVFNQFSFLNDTGLYFKSKSLNLDFNLESFRDKTLPFTKTTYTALPSELFKKLDIPFKFDTINVRNGFVAYEEIIENERGPGRIFFNDLTIQALNVTNDSAGGEALFHGRTRFMDAAELNVKFNIPADPSSDYKIDGWLEKFDLSRLNNMLKSAVLFEFKNGFIDRLDFNFKYNNDLSDGQVTVKYNDLKMVGYKKKQVDKVSIFKSIVINQILKVNSIKEATVRGKIQFQRDKRRSMFHYWWKSVLSGLKTAFITDGTIDPKKLEEE